MKEEIEDFCRINEVELFNKLNIKFEDGIFYNDGMGVFGKENSDNGVDVSLIEGLLIEDEYNLIDKVEIGDRVLFVNDYINQDLEERISYYIKIEENKGYNCEGI